jgi:hypothetical protein
MVVSQVLKQQILLRNYARLQTLAESALLANRFKALLNISTELNEQILGKQLHALRDNNFLDDAVGR